MDIDHSDKVSSSTTLGKKASQTCGDVRIDLTLVGEERKTSLALDEAHIRPWRELCVDFTQTTTCHGVRFLTESSKFFIRRVTWTLFLLGATALFLYLMLSKLIFFFEYNQTVSVAVVYNKTMKFPAVTVCNQNQFELTAVHKLSMMDALRSVRLKEENGTEYKEDKKSSRLFTPVRYICKLPENLKKHKAKVINEVPRYICRDICLKVFNIECRSLFYNRHLKQCIILKFEYVFETQKYSDCDVHNLWELYTRYFIFTCMFDDDNCPHISDEYPGKCPYKNAMITVSKINELLNTYLLPKNPRNLTDVTLGLSAGRVLAFRAISRAIENTTCTWSIVTPFFKSENMCLDFFYYLAYPDIIYTAFTISLIQYEYQVIDIDRITPEHESHIRNTWSHAFYKLPDGLFKIRVHAEHFNNDSLDPVLIDNLSIQKCSTFYEQTCKQYNIDAITTTDRMTEAARILPYCACDAGWFRYHSNGVCIPGRLTCNGQHDCTDGSDEHVACAEKIDITCDFEDQYICGYKVYGWVKQSASLLESTEGDDNYNPFGYYMFPNIVNIMSRDLVYLISPQKTFGTNFYLSFKFLSACYYCDYDNFEFLVVRNDGHVYLFSLTTNYQRSKDWSEKNICLPPGTYSVVFRAMSTEFDRLYADYSRFRAVDTIQAIDTDCTPMSSPAVHGQDKCTLNMTSCYNTHNFDKHFFRPVHGVFVFNISIQEIHVLRSIRMHRAIRLTSPLVKIDGHSCLSFNVQTSHIITVAVNIATIVGISHVQQSYFELNASHNLVKLDIKGYNSHFIATWIFFMDVHVHERHMPLTDFEIILKIDNILLNNSNLCHCNDTNAPYEDGKFVICEGKTPSIWNEESAGIGDWALGQIMVPPQQYGRDLTVFEYFDYDPNMPLAEDTHTVLEYDRYMSLAEDTHTGHDSIWYDDNPYVDDIDTPSGLDVVPRTTTENVADAEFDLRHLNDATFAHTDTDVLFKNYTEVSGRASFESNYTEYLNDLDVTISHLAANDSGHFLNESAHKFENFLLGCSWNRAEDKKCSQVEQVHTDLGVCYTFNANKLNPLNTTVTGMGLSMLLNVEQYSHIKGFTDYAGVKVFLHDQDELPFVRDLGIAVPPGMQALVALKYSKLTSVKAPWGNCSNAPSKFYEDDTYTRFRCLRSCETEALLEACGCRESYMQGPGEVCNVSAYLQCARGNRKSSRLNCDCHDPCQSQSFSGDVSYSHISLLHSDNLLDEKIKSNVKVNGLASALVRYRTENGFLETISLLQNVAHELTFVMTFIRRIDSVLIFNIEKALDSMIEGMYWDMRFLRKYHLLYGFDLLTWQVTPNRQFLSRIIQAQLPNLDVSITNVINEHLRGTWTKLDVAQNMKTFSKMVNDMENIVEKINSRILTPLSLVIANDTKLASYISLDLYSNLEFEMKRVGIQSLYICSHPYIIEELVEMHSYVSEICKMDGSFMHVHAREIIHSVYNSLMSITQDIKSRLYINHIHLKEAVHTLQNHLETYIYQTDTQTENDFIKSNIIKLDVFYGELKYEYVVQKPAYDMISFFSDFGGYMGLLLGCSVVTFLEVLDLFIYNALVKCKRRKKVKPVNQSQKKKRIRAWDAEGAV